MQKHLLWAYAMEPFVKVPTELFPIKTSKLISHQVTWIMSQDLSHLA